MALGRTSSCGRVVPCGEAPRLSRWRLMACLHNGFALDAAYRRGLPILVAPPAGQVDRFAVMAWRLGADELSFVCPCGSTELRIARGGDTREVRVS